MNRGPYSLPNPCTNPIARSTVGPAIWIIERVFALQQLNQIYEAGTTAAAVKSVHFADCVLESLNISYDAQEAGVAGIPRSGPLIVVANHPLGAVDGLVLHSLLRQVRPDIKLFGTTMLRRLEACESDFFFVDNFNTPHSPMNNLAATRSALRWLRAGGCLGVFPAGEVSHLTWQRRLIEDGPWNPGVARLAQAGNAAVVPIYFAGHNSAPFQLAGLIHPKLRTILLGREISRRRNSRICLAIGGVISPARLARFASAGLKTDYLRLRTYGLQDRLCAMPPKSRRTSARRTLRPLADPIPAHELAREIDSLPASHRLAAMNKLTVFRATADEIPVLIREIGRLRELSFRGVGEGTGRALDLDGFDRDYHHVFVWNHHAGELVGAYRLGLTDQILDRRGVGGLYTSTLFRYSQKLFRRIGPAIELGRSFVRPEYQKSFVPLNLLWRGIGTLIARWRRYRLLFGPVTISNDYPPVCKHLLKALLSQCRADSGMRKLVTPRNPAPDPGLRGIEHKLTGGLVQTVKDADELIAELDPGRSTVPVLLRQYLRLNARLLAFNVDPQFSNAVDALMVADLTTVDPLRLARYMGRESAATFLCYWNQNSMQTPAPQRLTLACHRPSRSPVPTLAASPRSPDRRPGVS